ncbi:T6SS phospholipase effector Tle1-like catalytic domain-containing protein [Xanthomonas translucens]|uniref:T6SS phospholipase effector Tle1-like catalytic domain-containing protein n=3 Tax=Xanthomonas campestris pv. translucens TaxID=343 RepID=UPI000B2F822F|nr:DUF2235 domain-containing protein [Xanthomonas translucens]MCT8272728.1 DUF2235 domain-containing protein [Xanthomonas translucens pv. undulosa]WNJ31818.1 DUF2235 domain-containing protein [Xanthomonas translucens pv. undulosa]
MTAVAYTAVAAPVTSKLAPSPPKLAAPAQTCRMSLSFSIFFDGTRNNRDYDHEDGSLSNIARLYESHDFNENKGVFRLYVPGVGTPFPMIGERRAHPDGASMGEMGAERIRYAFLYIANRIKAKLTGTYFVDEVPAKVTSAVANQNLLWQWAGSLAAMLAASTKPKIDEIVFDVFGFSRGAAAARSFISDLNYFFGNNTREGNSKFCGIPMRIRFLGIFDTVASVGYAGSFPLPVDGHQDWGDEPRLVVGDKVEQCVHIVAAHEARHSFPVDLIRRKNGTYGARHIEIVYPGVHSDVGGGYGKKVQGKGTPLSGNGISQDFGDKISQVALFDMHRRAIAAGVPLLEGEKLRARGADEYFIRHKEMADSFLAYAQMIESKVAGKPTEQHLLAHRQQYLGWRKQIIDPQTFGRQGFVTHSSEQDRINLIDANEEFRRQVQAISVEYPEMKKKWDQRGQIGDRTRGAPPPKPAGYEFVSDWNSAPVPNAATAAFFANYVHDSRAHFLLTDPQGGQDDIDIHQRLETKDRNYQGALKNYDAIQTNPDYMSYRNYAAKPVDPLSPEERANLEIYRTNGTPLYSDANPATKTDGQSWTIVDGIARFMGRRESDWTYLHKRQIFVYSRVEY